MNKSIKITLFLTVLSVGISLSAADILTTNLQRLVPTLSRQTKMLFGSIAAGVATGTTWVKMWNLKNQIAGLITQNEQYALRQQFALELIKEERDNNNAKIAQLNQQLGQTTALLQSALDAQKSDSSDDESPRSALVDTNAALDDPELDEPNSVGAGAVTTALKLPSAGPGPSISDNSSQNMELKRDAAAVVARESKRKIAIATAEQESKSAAASARVAGLEDNLEDDVHDWDYTELDANDKGTMQNAYTQFLKDTDPLVTKQREFDAQMHLQNLHALLEKYSAWEKVAKKIKSSPLDDIQKKRVAQRWQELEKLYIRSPWARGKDIINRLLKAGDVTAFIKQCKDSFEKSKTVGEAHHLQAMVDISWFLYAQAVKKGQPYKEGFTQVYDSKFVLFPFLMMIVDIVGGECRRISTHIPSVPGEQYGLDVPYDLRNTEGWIMPNGKYTLLFFLLDDGYLGVKAEDHGVYEISDRVAHAAGLVGSVKRKIVGGNDGPGFRKEHVPDDIIKALKIFLNRLWRNDFPASVGENGFNLATYNTKKERIKDAIKQARARGIWFIFKLIRRAEIQAFSYGEQIIKINDIHKEVLTIMDCINKYQWESETMSHRFGNEVFVDLIS